MTADCLLFVIKYATFPEALLIEAITIFFQVVQSVENGLTIWFFDHVKGNTYKPQEDAFAVVAEEVVKNLPEPEIVTTGSRVFYNMKSL